MSITVRVPGDGASFHNYDSSDGSALNDTAKIKYFSDSKYAVSQRAHQTSRIGIMVNF